MKASTFYGGAMLRGSRLIVLRTSITMVAFALTSMLFPFSSLRAFGVTWFDIAMVICLAFSAVVTGFRIFMPKPAIHVIVAYVVLMCIALSLSFFQTSDQSTHFSRSAILILTFGITWIFWHQAAWNFASSRDALLLLVLIACTVLSASVVVAAVTGNANFTSINDRSIGWAEHPIEAAYIAAFGLVLSSHILSRRFTVFGLILLAINIAGLRYAASVTGVVAAVIGMTCYIWRARSGRLSLLLLIGASTFLYMLANLREIYIISKISRITQQGVGYDTVDARIRQISIAWEDLDLSSLLMGNGFSSGEMIMEMDIHNGFVANIHHFGVFAIIATFAVFAYILRVCTSQSLPPRDRALVTAMFLVFFIVFVSSPALSRRSLWSPLIAIAAVMALPHSQFRCQKPNSRPSVKEV